MEGWVSPGERQSLTLRPLKASVVAPGAPNGYPTGLSSVMAHHILDWTDIGTSWKEAATIQDSQDGYSFGSIRFG